MSAFTLAASRPGLWQFLQVRLELTAASPAGAQADVFDRVKHD